MKKGIFCIIMCLLMVLTAVVPLSATTRWNETSHPFVSPDLQHQGMESLVNELQIKLGKVTTKQEAHAFVNEAIIELHKQGLLPLGMSVKRAQRFVDGYFSKSEYGQPVMSDNENTSGNTNCLVIGIANETFFRPFPTIYDVPLIYYLMFNTSVGDYFNFFIWFYAFRCFQPIKLGPYAWVGGKGKLVENGNVTQEYTDASSGWVWTIGENGMRKWNGTFYGGLNTRYRKTIIDNHTYAESWDPVGIRGFVGINLFSAKTFWQGNRVSTFYIGFAREINLTYYPPWP